MQNNVEDAWSFGTPPDVAEVLHLILEDEKWNSGS